ncbi:protein of unknown function [Candidatus Nitrosocosmicus franklandus]|uniref:Uncharacterized protein n=1 Tax=Candidatus Nitrosocosmicus franklandianus TaxID=1798806 RepID=A0A484I8W1_9ARCH|nr:protein of unknown function [Candidatus Nitrosocosmicus franklandus]
MQVKIYDLGGQDFPHLFVNSHVNSVEIRIDTIFFLFKFKL